METQTNARVLQEKIKGYIDELAKETDMARKSEVMQKYLDFVSKFHQYSSNNIWLIFMAKPDATLVAGFQAWKGMNRWVKKGEKGIPILAPMLHKEDPDKDDSPKILSGFRIVYVFDVAQTEGDPLPPVPDWKSPEKNAELNKKLIAFAESKGIEVTFKDLPGDVQGISKGKAIEIDSSAGTKTLIHEIAHELLHRKENLSHSRKEKELEAETVAFVVSKYFGIEDLHSSNYLILAGVNAADFAQSLGRIQDISAQIINRVIDINCK